MPEYTPDQFAAVLMGAIPKAVKETVQVVRKGSANVKRDGRRNSIVSSGHSAAAAPYSIDFEVSAVGVTVVGEIGYMRGNQAEFGALLEFGGGGDHSPPHRDLGRALEVEEPKFVEALADMGERVIE